MEERSCKFRTVAVSIVDGIPNFDIQWPTYIVATAVAIVRAVGIASVSFEYRSVITTMNWLQDLFDDGPGMFMATYSIDPEGVTGEIYVVYS